MLQKYVKKMIVGLSIIIIYYYYITYLYNITYYHNELPFLGAFNG